MSTSRRRSLLAVLGGFLLAISLTLQGSYASSGPEKKQSRSRVRQLRRHLARIVREGDSSLYLSGYAYHSRGYYGRLIKYLNEDAWGGGFGRTLQLSGGSVASLAATAFQDSLGNTEYNLGYMREWRTAPFDGRLKLGAGLSALVMSRSDYFDGSVFPAVLPQASLTYGGVTLIAVLVPRIPAELFPADAVPGLNGDIIYTFARIKL